MTASVLFLDYDGVIADSMGAKAEALADAFAPYTEDRAGVADGFRRHAGSGRELIFDRIYEDLIGEPLDGATRQRILGTFLDRIDAINAAIGLFPGVHGFIQGQAAKRLVAVVTGVPQEEAKRQLERLGLAPFLASVHGATRETPKHIHMGRFLEARAIAPADALFVGDSHADMREAALAGIPFVGIGEPAFFAARHAARRGSPPARPRAAHRRVSPASALRLSRKKTGIRRDLVGHRAAGGSHPRNRLQRPRIFPCLRPPQCVRSRTSWRDDGAGDARRAPHHGPGYRTGTAWPERGAVRKSRSQPRSACSTWARCSAR